MKSGEFSGIWIQCAHDALCIWLTFDTATEQCCRNRLSSFTSSPSTAFLTFANAECPKKVGLFRIFWVSFYGSFWRICAIFRHAIIWISAFSAFRLRSFARFAFGRHVMYGSFFEIFVHLTFRCFSLFELRTLIFIWTKILDFGIFLEKNH